MDCSWSGLIFHNLLDKKLHSCQRVWWLKEGDFKSLCGFVMSRLRDSDGKIIFTRTLKSFNVQPPFWKKGSSSVWWRTRGIYCCYITLRARRVTELSHQIIAFSLARHLSNYSAVNLITSSPSFPAKSITRVKKKIYCGKKNIFSLRLVQFWELSKHHSCPLITKCTRVHTISYTYYKTGMVCLFFVSWGVLFRQ